jgi:hypothetical protein
MVNIMGLLNRLQITKPTTKPKKSLSPKDLERLESARYIESVSIYSSETKAARDLYELQTEAFLKEILPAWQRHLERISAPIEDSIDK